LTGLDGATVFCGNFQGWFEQAHGWYDVDRDAQQLVQKLACLVQRSQPAMVKLPNGIGNLEESQIPNDQAFAFECHFRDKPLGLGGVRFRKDPLGDDAAIDDGVTHRLRSSAMSAALSGK
jgi:hypothetical protein